MRKTNQAGVDLIKGFEKLRTHAYQDSVGVWTIGYGHTGRDVYSGLTITEEQAEKYLRFDLTTAELGVEKALAEQQPRFYTASDLTDNEFAACVSLTFNIGVGTFAKSSVAKLISSRDMETAADRFLLYNKARVKGKLVVLKGLTVRREAERKLFLTPDEEVEQPIEDDGLPTIPNGTVTEPPSQQTVETGGAGTQVVVGGGMTTEPVISQPDDAPIQASTGSKKSLYATIVGGLTALPTAIWGVLQANAEAIKWALIAGGAVLCVYLFRQLVLDVMRMWTASDPKKYSVK